MEKIVKPDTPSLRRRQLMFAAITAPSVMFAPQLRAALTAELSASPRGEAGALIVSGRMVNGHGKPLAGALVEVLDSGSKAGASATTDADGRFLFTTVVPRETLNYRVSREGRGTVVKQLHFAHKPGVTGDQVAQLQRDDAGIWRTTFGVALA